MSYTPVNTLVLPYASSYELHSWCNVCHRAVVLYINSLLCQISNKKRDFVPHTRELPRNPKIGARHVLCNMRTGLSQMQLQKSLEQYQKIPKSVVVQHKIGVPMINVKNRT